MRKLIAAMNMSLDGFCDHTAMTADEEIHDHFTELLRSGDSVLYGRITYQLMTATKYVASNTRDSSDWQPTVFLGGDLAGKVRELKQTDGPDLHVFGSADMLQTLFKNDLVDGLELMIFPITLGQGKRLFNGGSIPAAFKVTESQVTPNGVVSATYERDGDVKTGAPQIEENV